MSIANRSCFVNYYFTQLEEKNAGEKEGSFCSPAVSPPSKPQKAQKKKCPLHYRGIPAIIYLKNKNAAAYGYVLGHGNPNLTALTETVDDLNRIAEGLYPGYTGKLIDKEYKFNQYISDHHVLVEVGNNENTIEQAKMTGYYLAEIFAAYLKERGI